MDKPKNEPTARDLALSEVQNYEPIFEEGRETLDPPRTVEELQNVILEILDEYQAITNITEEIRKQLQEHASQPAEKRDMETIGEDLRHNPHTRSLVLTELIDGLLEKTGVHADPIDIRFLVHKINKAASQPIILGLPNTRHSDRPFYTKLQHDEPLPPEVVELLDYFTF